jgi:hypothetical protein
MKCHVAIIIRLELGLQCILFMERRIPTTAPELTLFRRRNYITQSTNRQVASVVWLPLADETRNTSPLSSHKLRAVSFIYRKLPGTKLYVRSLRQTTT